MSIKNYYCYWGKIDRNIADNTLYHRLVYHCLDVAAVMQCFLHEKKDLTGDIAKFLGLTEDELTQLLVILTALHDLGKFAAAFQGLNNKNVVGLYLANSRRSYDASVAHHDRLGCVFWKQVEESFLNHIVGDKISVSDREKRQLRKVFSILSGVVLGHHGRPIDHSSMPLLEIDYIEPNNKAAAQGFFNELCHIFPLKLSINLLINKDFYEKVKLLSWLLAGMVVVADWVGSDSSYFPYQTDIIPLDKYWARALKQARVALDNTELIATPKINAFKSVKEHFPFNPSPLQQWAETVAIDKTPQLFILEDVTGAGKTEAALVLTHRLLEIGAAEGFYFGLPTMATSNAMFKRVAEYYTTMLTQKDGQPVSIVLAHAARDMHSAFRTLVVQQDSELEQSYTAGDDSITMQCNQWLADSRKKALLAPVGVGTIDQALLAVLPRKHQSLRVLGLSKKVLVFDEVHAADTYMFELLEKLLLLQAHHGSSVILLTATLPKKTRERLVNIWLSVVGKEAQALKCTKFPLATRVNLYSESSVHEVPIGIRENTERSVAVNFINTMTGCIDQVLSAVKAGKSVVWVRNVVSDAIEAYQQIKEKVSDPEQVLLFHSRFVLDDRQKIEAQVIQWSVPRISGDEPLYDYILIVLLHCSPHKRG